MIDITAEERFVLFLSQPNLTRDSVDQHIKILRLPDMDLDKVLQFAGFNGIAPVIYSNIQHVDVFPKDFMDKLKVAYISTKVRNMLHLKQTLSILDLLESENIPAIPLKGSLGSAILLGDPGCYPTSDIDILVPFESLQKAGGALLASGYSDAFSENELSGNYHRTYCKESISLELHWNLVKTYFDISPGFWLEDMRTIEVEARPVLQPAPEKYLLYLIFRLFSHGFAPLRFFILITGLIKKEHVDWEKVYAAAEKVRMTRLTLFTLNILVDFFDTDIPIEKITGKIIGYQFIKRLILKELFSKEQRPYLRMLVYLSLLDSPVDICKVVIKKVLPSPAEIRLRYNLPHNSLKILPYYLFNPFIMMFKSVKR